MERVYVGNLPPDIRIKDIDDFFRPFGKLVSIDVNNRSNPAFAYVQFDNERNAINAVRARCGYDYEGYTLQVKLGENTNDRGFEVRNQRRQVTPPPPPPMFNEYSDQSSNSRGVGNNFGNNDFHNNNQGGYGNNDYGNNNFGNKFLPDNTNFMNPPSLFQSNMSPQNIQYPTNNMSPQNMIEYPSSSRWSANSNIGGGDNRSGGGFDRSSGSFDQSGDRNGCGFNANVGGFGGNVGGFGGNVGGFGGNVSGFDRTGGSPNLSGDGFNRSGGGFNHNDGGFNRNDGGFNRTDGGFNRTDGSFNRNDGGFNRNDGGSNRGIGVSYRERSDNDNRYNDEKYEDSFTQGLSGSGRKWFNRYIRKGFSAKIAREKALEHRTVPYLRGGTNFDEIPNNANLPLPALENIGNKLISLFGNGVVDNIGGNNGNQMAPNFSNWGGDNFQGDFTNNHRQNEYNMSGRSSSNYDERSSMSRRPRNRSNREGKPEAIKEKGVLEKMLEEIPTYNQRKIVARQHYVKSLSILKRLEAKKDRDFKDRKSRQHHKKIVQEYEDSYKNPQATRNVKPAEPSSRGGGQMSKSSTMSSFRKGAELKKEYQRKKSELYEEARRLPDFPRGILTESARGKVRQLIRQGFEQNGAKVLARLSLTKIKKFIETKIEYENAMKDLIRGSSNKTTATATTTTTTTTPKTSATTKTIATAKVVAPKTVATAITNPRSDKDAAYYNNVKLLKKYEESKTINDNIKRLLLTCLKKVRQYEEAMKLPKTVSKFENLLPKVVVTVAKKAEPIIAKKVENKVESKNTKNETPTTASKENVINEDKPPPKDTKKIEDENENANVCETEEKSELNVNDQEDEEEEEITADQNEEDNAELHEGENEDDDNVDLTEDQNEDEDNVEFIEDEDEDNAELQQDENEDEDNVECNEDQNEDGDNMEFTEDQNEDEDNVDQNDENENDLTEQEQEDELENEDEN